MLTPAWTKFKPHEVQNALWHSKARFIVVPAGRRCLEAGTLVATPQGPRAIENLQVGDAVFGFENGRAEITQVEAVWDNGIQQVYPVGNAYHKYLAGTTNHKLWAANERYLKEEDYSRIEIPSLDKRKRVRRVYLFDMIQGGAIRQERTYSLGCMLGDGCCRQNKPTIRERKKTNHVYISSPNDIVPKRMAQELGCEVIKQHETNYSWKLAYAYDKIPYYRKWCRGRYSNEKIADWSIIDTWDKMSCLAFLSGIIDTDGCIRYKTVDYNQIIIQIAMQAKSVVECCQKIVFKYFQEFKPILIDNRDRYVRGPVYILNITDNLLVKRILEEIEPYSVKRIDYSVINPRNYRDDRIGIYPIGDPYLAHTYDITVANSTNLYVLHDGGIITSNSGKSAIAKRKLVLSALDPNSGYPDPNYFAAAPVQQQAERIYWKDLLKLIPKSLIVKISKSDHSIELYNGATIYVVGLDKPERIEGVPWNGCVLDEYANMKKQAWTDNVMPALADRNGWAWLIGVPEGRNHYHDLYQFACDPKNHPEWAAFTWKSSDILPPKQIAIARASLDELTFRQEFEACHLPDTEVALGLLQKKKIKDIIPGDTLLTYQEGNVVECKVEAVKKTGHKNILQVELETGELFAASDCHKMRIGDKPVQLKNCEYLEKVFIGWEPQTVDAKLAAIVGANLGDGTITRRKVEYSIKNKTYSYNHLRASFYSIYANDLCLLSKHIRDCGLSKTAKVIYNKSKNIYEVLCGHKGSLRLVDLGCAIGKKVEQQTLGVPEWVKNGTNEVKRAFCAAFFGAEGTTPQISHKGYKGYIYINLYNKKLLKEINAILQELNVETTYVDKNKISAGLYARDGFYENVGFLYCEHKSIKFWQYKIYEKASHSLHRECKRLHDSGLTYKDVGGKLGLKTATVRQFVHSTNSTRIPSWFPTFEEWKKEKCNGQKIRLNIVDKKYLGEQEVWNITVDSPDHSYLLANQIDNFNSFVSFEGRCYYPFLRETHCAPLRKLYNPRGLLAFCFDFNVDPGVAAVCQEVKLPNGLEGTAVIGEVYIPRNSNTPSVCRKLIQDWGKHEGRIVCYGDATGGSRGSAKVQGSDWDLIKAEFRQSPLASKISYDVPRANPPERARVNAVNSRLKSETGQIRLMVDPEYAPHVVKDFEGVILLKGGSGEIDKKATPELSHMCFCAGTKIITDKGVTEIDNAIDGGMVKSWAGQFEKYDGPYLAAKDVNIISACVSNGNMVMCTPEHSFLTSEGWICAQNLEGHILMTPELLLYAVKQSRCFRGTAISDLMEKNGISAVLIMMANNIYTELSGYITMGQFQTDSIFTTLMEIERIIRLKISRLLTGENIYPYTIKTLMPNCLKSVSNGFYKQELKPQNGMEVKRGEHGIENMQRELKQKSIKKYAHGAEKNLWPHWIRQKFAVKIANHDSVITKALIMRCVIASIVEKSFQSINMPRKNIAIGPAPLQVKEVRAEGSKDVYCITVPDTGCFCLENGAIVSNSDAFGYYVQRKFPIVKHSSAMITLSESKSEYYI